MVFLVRMERCKNSRSDPVEKCYSRVRVIVERYTKIRRNHGREYLCRSGKESSRQWWNRSCFVRWRNRDGVSDRNQGYR
ncbi:hypothetical protein NY2A_b243R [Paramecium bursaria Chlorella virus NY2A]|uniref:Uncharacterized protein b243R n=1 Tax=Paramecium bursaria Chlorella virus NY2A TaxID=46021 RepID=A7IWB8_PBCVN|nr:hypothetical protein NY2A_b243R [Paramecium bursaria Chlorella virus NY2A]YP_001498306.1 hypothetical protein AR158_c224R [Paramecium bursaria Chlorella virus AR158]ABT14642.1 hypothetical protein NY2A_b243R [Paramecium bursaria Chlorella virus NY2A]ABU43770.1 hypothetical protein AR158_c224R [Paramecium bursaria Chlorella virus AR158]